MEQNVRGEHIKVYVWEPPVRLFHWTLVATVLFSWASAELGGNWMDWHLWSGYLALTLVLFRILWGFVGGSHARFSDFLYRPRSVWEYAKTLSQPSAWMFVGHTPLGGVGILLILLCLLIQAGTGLFANDDIATEGPWAHRVGKDTSDLLSAIHSYNFDVLMVLVAGHVAVVFYYLLRKRHNLIVPMLTGYKTLRPDAPARQATGMNGRALIVLGVALVSVWLLVRGGGG